MKTRTSLVIPSNHPVFAGHFPGAPIVPGALLLDEVVHFIASETKLTTTQLQISTVKFLSPLKPDEIASIEYEQLANGSIQFKVLVKVLAESRQIAVGSFTIPAASQ